jgi:cobalt-zinc-cadmium efflux system outer membrane protein
MRQSIAFKLPPAPPRWPRILGATGAILLALAPIGRAQGEPEAQSISSLTLDAAVASVIRHNDRAAASRYMAVAAERKIGPAGAWDDPMLMVGVANLPTSGSFTSDMMTMTMVGLSQTIPYAGQKGLAANAAAAQAAAEAEMSRGTEIDLVTAAKLAFFECYYRRRILDDLQSQRDLLQQVVASVQAKLRTNQANQEDLSAAQADLWRLDARILSAGQEVDAARYDLSALMGSAPDDTAPVLTAPPTTPIPTTVELWERAAEAHYPPLRRLAKLAESYSQAARAASRMRWPMLTLNASYGFRRDGPAGPRDDMIDFGANLSLPIFAGRKQSDMALSMQAMQQSSDAQARQLWLDVRGKLRTLHARAHRLDESIDLYRARIIPAADDAFRSAFAGYSANRTSFLSLLTYAGGIYRDRVTADLLQLDLARTLAEAERYTTDTGPWEAVGSNHDQP